jgi:hypothetical protein
MRKCATTSRPPLRLTTPRKLLSSPQASSGRPSTRRRASLLRDEPCRPSQVTGIDDLLLVGHLDEAERMLAELDPTPFPPAWRTAYELAVAGIAIRRLRTQEARAALARAKRAAHHARIPALTAEVESASLVLNTPAARQIANGEEQLLLLEEVEALLASKALVVDACRHVVRNARTVISITGRPVLFALARALGEAWPGDVPRDLLLAKAFEAKACR